MNTFKMSFKNKVVLVTGASSGIGAATAVLFAKEGADVAMVGRNETKLKKVSQTVEKTGKKPLVIIADVAKDEDAKRIIKETVSRFGKLDVLVNNAGFAKLGSILDGKVLESYDEIMSVNVRAVVNLTMLAAPHLIATKGNIINISSVAAMTVPSNPGFIAYATSKAALDHFNRGAALELAPSGVRVNCVNPGPVVTDFLENAGMEAKWEDFENITALGRSSATEEIADLILYLASDKAKGVTGSTYVLDNGYMLKN